MFFKQQFDTAAPLLQHSLEIGVRSAAAILHRSCKSSILSSLIPANEIMFFYLWWLLTRMPVA